MIFSIIFAIYLAHIQTNSQMDFSMSQLQLMVQMSYKISILPSFNSSQLYLLSGQIPLLKANHEATVPLWLALFLKKKQKCKIVPPHFLREAALQETYQKQQSNTQLCHLQCDNFFEVIYILLNEASNDFQNAMKVRNLADSIRDLRQQKIKNILKSPDGFKIDNITMYETNKFRKGRAMLSKSILNLQSNNQ